MRRWLIALAALLLILAGAAVWVVQSDWLRRKVHARIVDELEAATGGRVTLGGFDFDWRTGRAELRDIEIHGLEPAGAAPLFQARRIVAGLKVISLWRRKFDLLSLEAEAPRVNVLVDKEGRTNVPVPACGASPKGGRWSSSSIWP